jgi:hypothetical protein
MCQQAEVIAGSGIVPAAYRRHPANIVAAATPVADGDREHDDNGDGTVLDAELVDEPASDAAPVIGQLETRPGPGTR